MAERPLVQLLPAADVASHRRPIRTARKSCPLTADKLKVEFSAELKAELAAATEAEVRQLLEDLGLLDAWLIEAAASEFRQSPV